MRKSLLFIILLGLLVSCQQEDGAGFTEAADGEPVSQAVLLEGRVRVKFKAGVESELNVVQTRTGTTSGIESFDLAGRDLHVYRMERVFPPAGRFEERHRQHGLHLWYDVYFDRSVPTRSAVDNYRDLPGVESVGGIPVMALPAFSRVPVLLEPLRSALASRGGDEAPPFNDPNLGNQWSYHNGGESVNGLSGALEGADINLFEAWQRETGSPEVIVAVMDGGIQYDHPDLAGNMWVNRAEKDGQPGVDDDNNGYVDDIYGFNFVTAKIKTDDQGRKVYTDGRITPHVHGTHCAGTIAAVNGNGTGVCGIAGGSGKGDGVRLMSCQIFADNPDSEDGMDRHADPNMFVYAADMGAVISSNSWALVGATELDFMNSGLKTAIDYFVRHAGTDLKGGQDGPMKGGLVVFAAGNDNTDQKQWPSAYTSCFSVSALAHNFRRAGYSNFGTWVNIAAPGGDQSYGEEYGILSTVPGDRYDYLQGTSMSCPHVTGCAALVLSKFQGPGYVPRSVRERLENSARDMYGYNKNFVDKLGVGLVDVGKALTPPSLEDPASSVLTVVDAYDDWAILEWEVKAASDGPMNRYVISWSRRPMSEWGDEGCTVGEKSVPVRKIAAGTLVRDTLRGLEAGATYYFSLRAYDRWGGVSAPSPEVSRTLKENLPPVLEPSWQGDVLLDEGGTRRLTVRVVDPEGQSFRSSLSLPQEWMVLEDGDGEVLLELTPGYRDAGTYPETLTVTDEYGKKTELQLVVEVVYRETAPVQLLPFEDLKLGRRGQEVRLDLDRYFEDPKGRGLVYEVESSDVDVAVVRRLGGTLTVEGISFGKATVLVRAINSGGASVSRRFVVEVVPSFADGQELLLYPNPVVRTLDIRLLDAYQGQVELRLFNAAGRQVVGRKVTVGADGYVLDMSGMQAGTYLLSIEGKNRNWKKNIIKL